MGGGLSDVAKTTADAGPDGGRADTAALVPKADVARDTTTSDATTDRGRNEETASGVRPDAGADFRDDAADSEHRDASRETTPRDGSSDLPTFNDAKVDTIGGIADAQRAGRLALQSLGYYTGDRQSYDSVVQNRASITMVSAHVFKISTDGKLTGGDALNLSAYTATVGIDMYACVKNSSGQGFDPAIGHAAMVTNRSSMISALLALANTGWAGINVDFENLAYSDNIDNDREAYTSFVHALATGLHAAGKKLILSVPGKNADSRGNTWSYPFDYVALARDADFLQLMTYDQHGPGWSEPGPVSGLDWVKARVAYAASVVSPDKLLIGLPAYGYDWDLTAAPDGSVGKAVSWTGFSAVLATPGASRRWDSSSESPYVDYTGSDGHARQLWYEDSDSIKAKTALITQFQLAGLSMWALGKEDVGFWQAAYSGL